MTLMLEPPPRTLPMDMGMERPFNRGFDVALNDQSCSPPRRVGQAAAFMMFATSSLPPASSRSTLTSMFSANRRATTDPDDPDPQTMKS
jgi:hypothetical protein